MSDAIRWYDRNISVVAPRYESVEAETVHGWLVDLLPDALALALDVGVGTGRDAAWLALSNRHKKTPSRGNETASGTNKG